jgi:predicted phosphoribosyltransferase
VTGLSSGRFADLAAGGSALAPLVVAALLDDGLDPGAQRGAHAAHSLDPPIVLAVVPNGVPAGLEVAAALAAPMLALEVERAAGGEPVMHLPGGLAGRTVIVADDGVETGTAAHAAGLALRQADVARSVLAVPVCPRDAQATLDLVYDLVVAAVRPLGRRALTWHYARFDALDPDDARARIAAYRIERERG